MQSSTLLQGGLGFGQAGPKHNFYEAGWAWLDPVQRRPDWAWP